MCHISHPPFISTIIIIEFRYKKRNEHFFTLTANLALCEKMFIFHFSLIKYFHLLLLTHMVLPLQSPFHDLTLDEYLLPDSAMNQSSFHFRDKLPHVHCNKSDRLSAYLMTYRLKGIISVPIHRIIGLPCLPSVIIRIVNS